MKSGNKGPAPIPVGRLMEGNKVTLLLDSWMRLTESGDVTSAGGRRLTIDLAFSPVREYLRRDESPIESFKLSLRCHLFLRFIGDKVSLSLRV
ncbi:hypothetical protein J1N35_032571 [Gossypium stocksii]|uniref:Uncharacterized protein n=1 Tax=Gossypium stocksii TaxID=47602 RepID=A0A9D3ZWX2_9ROSI|nr:hypothetical protein J1N35_032571 [Gossypium stocksii]